MACKPSDPCYVFNGKLNSMSERMPQPIAINGLDVIEEDGPRKRTVSEALDRVQGAGSPIWKVGKQFPFTKPYAYALQGLTYALVLVDPLDRLEGGLID